MAKLKMEEVRIIALKKDRKRILEHLQNSGLVQIKKYNGFDKNISKTDLTSQMKIFSKNSQLAEQALKILDEVSPEKNNLFDSLKGRKEVDPDIVGDIASSAGKVIADCSRIVELNKIRKDNSGEQVKIATEKDRLHVWKNLDIPLDTADTKSTAVFIGTLPDEYNESALKRAITTKNPKLEFEFEIEYVGEHITCVAIFTPISQKAMAIDILRTLGFTKPLSPTNHTPSEKIKRLNEKSISLEEESKKALNEIAALACKRQDIRYTLDYFTIRTDKYRVINELGHTNHIFVLCGYIPTVDKDKLTKMCERIADCCLEFKSAGNDAPVKLKNNKFTEPAQNIVTMYSPPSRYDIDPTPLLAFFFYFFFGMMFSDAGYGILMTIVIGIILKFFKPDKPIENTLKLFWYCGISTFIWGLIFGSFFGDAPAKLFNFFTGSNITMADIFPWPTLDPQKDALTLMIISIAFGFVHIMVGMGCKFYICLKQKDFGGAFFDTGLWMMLLMGIAVIAAGIVTTPILIYIGASISIACAIGLVLTQGRHKKGFGKVTGGLASLYNITGYISDLLSYSRLLALGLTTGVMAQVFNMLATMFGANFIGSIIMVIIMISGHAINIGLNALGSYVHTMRLQYVEMFSKFYEGGGREFEPFSVKSKYIKIQEDK